jgi:hypothetical protein
MTSKETSSSPPRHPPEIDPLPPMQTGPPRYGDVDQSTWDTGVVVTTILAALVVVAAIVWAASGDEETVTNSPPTNTGQAFQPAK